MHNYELVHADGEVSTDKPAIDERFNVVKENTVKIRRTVQVLQWVENSEQRENQEPRYFYEKEWLEHIVNQNTFREPQQCFGPSNPVTWPCDNQVFNCDKVSLEKFELSEQQIQRYDNYTSVDASTIFDQCTTSSSQFFEENSWVQLRYEGGEYLFSR